MDDLKLKELEDKEVESVLRELKPLLPESDEYSHVVDNYIKLRKIQMEGEKAEREIENAKKERIDQHIHKAIGYGLDIGKFAAGLAVYCALYKIGLKFEETGSISSHPMRELIGSINPFRKK